MYALTPHQPMLPGVSLGGAPCGRLLQPPLPANCPSCSDSLCPHLFCPLPIPTPLLPTPQEYVEAGRPVEDCFSRNRSFNRKIKRYGRFVPRGEGEGAAAETQGGSGEDGAARSGRDGAAGRRRSE